MHPFSCRRRRQIKRHAPQGLPLPALLRRNLPLLQRRPLALVIQHIRPLPVKRVARTRNRRRHRQVHPVRLQQFLDAALLGPEPSGAVPCQQPEALAVRRGVKDQVGEVGARVAARARREGVGGEFVAVVFGEDAEGRFGGKFEFRVCEGGGLGVGYSQAGEGSNSPTASPRMLSLTL